MSSFKYLGVNISEDLTWTTHIQTQVKKARQRLYHLRQLRKFRVSPAILKIFYSGAIESVLTQCISVWYNNATNQDCKALQRVVRLAERISRFFIIRHIHNHTSIISSEMQVELKKNTTFTWGKGGEKNNPQTMLLGEYSVRTGKTPQQHKSTYTT